MQDKIMYPDSTRQTGGNLNWGDGGCRVLLGIQKNCQEFLQFRKGTGDLRVLHLNTLCPICCRRSKWALSARVEL